MKNKIITFIPGISRVLSNITPVVILFVLSKFIAADKLGELNYFMSLITLIGVFTDFGLPEAVQKFLTHYEIKKIIFPTIVLEIILSTIGAFLFAILDIASGNSLSFGNTLIIFLILVASSSNVIILVFNGLQNNFKTSLYFLGASLLFIFLTFALFFSGAMNAVQAFLWGRLISWVVFSVIPIFDLYRSRFLSVTLTLPRRFITFAINNFIIVFSYSMFNQWDSILITRTLGEYQNGIYKSVAFLASAPYVISVILNTKLLPEYSKMHSEHKYSEVRKSFLSYTKILALGAFILVLLSIPLANFGLTIVYNFEVASNGYFYFAPILLAILIYVVAIPSVSLLQAIGKEHIVRNASLIQSIGFVVLSTILLPIFGLAILPILLIIINSMFFIVNFYFANKFSQKAL